MLSLIYYGCDGDFVVGKVLVVDKVHQIFVISLHYLHYQLPLEFLDEARDGCGSPS
jgi:hypothetical protein